MNEPLKACPLCGTEVTEQMFGLRDYRWLEDALPGRVAPTDLDFVLERGGRVLIMEYKPKGALLSMGQRLTLRTFVRMGADVWIGWENEDGHVDVGVLDRAGAIHFIEKRIPRAKLRRRVHDWFESAKEEE